MGKSVDKWPGTRAWGMLMIGRIREPGKFVDDWPGSRDLLRNYIDIMGIGLGYLLKP